MQKIVVVHSRKGGVGKSTVAYELAWLLGAVLVDLEWESGGVTGVWGYRWQDRQRSPMLAALERGTTPRPLTGHRKPDLVPGHPDLQHLQPTAEDMADALTRWAEEWDRWIVVDTHPGSAEAINGALSVAHVVVVPTPLATKDLNGTADLVDELADYPVVLVPNKVPRVAPAAEIQRIRAIIAGTPVQVGPPLPWIRALETRKKRMAITAEDPAAKILQPFADRLHDLADYLKEYTRD